MGIGVSGWRLAQAVSAAGQLGVVSGTALDVLFVRRLQLGDPGGHLRQAMAAFPFPQVAARLLDTYYVEGGKDEAEPYASIAMFSAKPSVASEELTIAATFAEVRLAKQGHANPVGLNLLEKIQVPTLHALYGAMLAGVDAVLMGAGIPRQIPGILDRLAAGEAAQLRLDITGASAETALSMSLDPVAFARERGVEPPVLERPLMLAIVTSHVLAGNLAKKASGRIDGFIVEEAIAGGHNAPPRGAMQLSEEGEPIYGPRDAPDYAKFRALGRPFWLAGGYGRPGKLEEAKELGAAGIQVGTAFAFCEESGVTPELKAQALAKAKAGGLEIFTDPTASPTGFPFKLAQLAGTVADPEVVAARQLVCDVGLLRQTYIKEDGTPGYRCPSEPGAAFLRKGGCEESLCGRQCICNGLIAGVGLGQIRSDGSCEPPMVTAGNEAVHVAEFLPPGAETYTAADVVEKLLEPALLPA